MSPTKSVEEICQAIERYQLMSSKDLAAMRARWFRPNRQEAADPEQFRRWLVLNKYLTDFVAKVVSGRKSEQVSGGYIGGVPPVPIPNTEVKPSRADGTAWFPCG